MYDPEYHLYLAIKYLYRQKHMTFEDIAFELEMDEEAVEQVYRER
jgi:hypothetical protein